MRDGGDPGIFIVAGLFYATGSVPLVVESFRKPPTVTPPVVAPPPPVAPTPRVEPTPPPVPAPPPEIKAPAEVKPPPPKKSPALPVAARPSMDRKRYLDALRGLASGAVHQCSLNIGLLADAVENESLTKADADRTLTTITELMTLVDRQLEKVVSDQVDVKEEKCWSGSARRPACFAPRRGR